MVRVGGVIFFLRDEVAEMTRSRADFSMVANLASYDALKTSQVAFGYIPDTEVPLFALAKNRFGTVSAIPQGVVDAIRDAFPSFALIYDETEKRWRARVSETDLVIMHLMDQRTR